MTQAISLRITALITVLLVPLLAVPTSAAQSTAVTRQVVDARGGATDRAATARVIRFGQVGKARAGMSHAQAMATGELNEDVPNPPCDPIRLQPKKPYRYQYVVLVNGADRIAEIDVTGRRVRTAKGLGVGSTNAQVQAVYGARLSPPVEVGFQQWGRFVSRGTGADRRWIGFLFGRAAVDDGPLVGSDVVTLVGVRKRFRPALLLDGC